MFIKSPLLHPEHRDAGLVINHHFLVVHPDLNGHPAGIVGVDDGIEHRFAYSRAGEGVPVHTRDAVIRNPGAHVLGIDEVDNLVGLTEKGAFQSIIVEDFGIVLEEAHLDESPGKPTRGVRMKQQKSGPFETPLFIQQFEALQKLAAGDIKILRTHAAVTQGFALENLETDGIELLRRNAVYRYGIPLGTRLFE